MREGERITLTTDSKLFNFLVPLAVREGATVVCPHPLTSVHRDIMREITALVRQLPASVESPDPKEKYPFAVREARGHWLMVWIPDGP